MASKFETKLNSFRKRSRIDVMATILNVAGKGARKTRIMFRCNLSYRQLEVYLKRLLDVGLLASHSNLFETTAKGLEFLDAYCTLEALMT